MIDLFAVADGGKVIATHGFAVEDWPHSMWPTLISSHHKPVVQNPRRVLDTGRAVRLRKRWAASHVWDENRRLRLLVGT